MDEVLTVMRVDVQLTWPGAGEAACSIISDGR
jgi:hypothetical protein